MAENFSKDPRNPGRKMSWWISGAARVIICPSSQVMFLGRNTSQSQSCSATDLTTTTHDFHLNWIETLTSHVVSTLRVWREVFNHVVRTRKRRRCWFKPPHLACNVNGPGSVFWRQVLDSHAIIWWRSPWQTPALGFTSMIVSHQHVPLPFPG